MLGLSRDPTMCSDGVVPNLDLSISIIPAFRPPDSLMVELDVVLPCTSREFLIVVRPPSAAISTVEELAPRVTLVVF